MLQGWLRSAHATVGLACFIALLLTGCRGPKGAAAPGATIDQGSNRAALINVKNAPFAAYDTALINTVQQRWLKLLAATGQEQKGTVTIKAQLTQDGRIINLTRTNNDVPEDLARLSERALLEPAPYAPWPDEMRKRIGSDVREIEFNFRPPR